MVRNKLKENQERGKLGEEDAKRDLELMGYEVIRKDTLKRGSDFLARRTSPVDLRSEIFPVEVKTGNSRLSQNQTESKQRYGRRYKILRPDSDFLDQ